MIICNRHNATINGDAAVVFAEFGLIASQLIDEISKKYSRKFAIEMLQETIALAIEVTNMLEKELKEKCIEKEKAKMQETEDLLKLLEQILKGK